MLPPSSNRFGLSLTSSFINCSGRIRCWLVSVLLAALLLISAILGTGDSVALSAEGPRVTVLENSLSSLASKGDLNIEEASAVASFVFSQLAEAVRVYPTENYYYFRFHYDGLTYSGNFRLDVRDRDTGKLHFAFYEDLADWKPDGPTHYLVLDSTTGFAVKRIRALVYDVAHNGKRVRFLLNDLSDVSPTSESIAAGETYLGPVFDDSGLRFFLIYAPQTRTFLYVLDETTRPSDTFEPLADFNRITIGRRTGFAFYSDHALSRRILIGIEKSNALLNTYLDGPFDQLPENFIEGDTLKQAIVHADANAKGKIDRLGYYSRTTRYTIAPYMLYKTVGDLASVDACAKAARDKPSYYGCFNIAGGD